MLSYLQYILGYDIKEDKNKVNPRILFSEQDLKNVKLKKTKPIPKVFNLNSLTHKQLYTILNVKLKKNTFPLQKKIYKPKHPVLCELLSSVNRV